MALTHPQEARDNARRLWLAAALTPPLLVQLIWLLHNTGLPVADAVEQLQSVSRLYHYAATGHITRFLYKLYSIRFGQWRPTAYYLVQLPFMLVSKGNLLFSVSAATLACTAVSCTYLYRLLRLAAGPAQAAAGAALLGTLGIVQWPAGLLGFSESAFLPAILATLYHLIRSDNLRNTAQCACMVLAVAVAFAMRPVEAFTHLFLPFAFYLWVMRRRGYVSGAQLYGIALCGMAGLSLLVFTGLALHGVIFPTEIYHDTARGHVYNKLALLIFLPTGLLLALHTAHSILRCLRQAPLNPPVRAVPVILVIYGVILLLYLPCVPQLVEWVYMCSLGDLAQRIAPRHPSLYALIRDYLVGPTGLVPCLGIAGVSILSFCFCLSAQKRRELLRHPLLFLPAAAPVTLVIMLTSVQCELRKMTVIMTLILLVILVPALTQGRMLRLRTALVAALALLQAVCMGYVSAANPNTPVLQQVTGRAFPNQVTISPNPDVALAAFVKDTAVRHGYHHILEPVATNTTDGVDPFLQAALGSMMGNPAGLTFPYLPSFDDGTVAAQLAMADALLLIHDQPGAFVISPEEASRLKAIADAAHDPNDKLRFTLLAMVASGDFDRKGIRRDDCTFIEPVHKQACLFALPAPAKAP